MMRIVTATEVQKVTKKEDVKLTHKQNKREGML